MTEISEDEYKLWLKSADKIGREYCEFSSFAGSHSFVRDIEKGGVLYNLFWGWDIVDRKNQMFYGVKCLHKLTGQEGDGI